MLCKLCVNQSSPRTVFNIVLHWEIYWGKCLQKLEKRGREWGWVGSLRPRYRGDTCESKEQGGAARKGLRCQCRWVRDQQSSAAQVSSLRIFLTLRTDHSYAHSELGVIWRKHGLGNVMDSDGCRWGCRFLLFLTTGNPVLRHPEL